VSLRPLRGSTPDVVAALRDWLAVEPEPAPVIVETSGSTGRPKRVLLSRRALTASATATHERLGGPGRWLLTLPVSYVAGLQGVVRSLLAGHEPAVLGDRAFAEAAAGCRYVSLVPTQLHRLLADAADREALAGFDAVLLGGGPKDPGLRARAEAAGVRVVATYGSSETCGGCVYDGVPLPGVEIDVDQQEGGRIRIRGAVLFDGYDGDPGLTAETLVDGWFLTSDLGRVDDGRLRVLGRVDDVVISGGVNVPTPAVARRLRAHPDVRAVEVIGVDDPEWGQRVVAVVVGRLSLGQARDWVAVEHPRSWAPRDVVAVDALPMLDTGKVDRLRLRLLAAAEEDA
jgi:O-succinylbenzoic acid--CoA ligase